MFKARFCRSELTQSSIELEINAGESLTLVGPASSGKTAFGFLACGLPLPKGASGCAFLNGLRIDDLAPRQRAAMLSYIPSDPTLLFSGMKATVFDELLFSKQMLGDVVSPADEDVRKIIELFQLQELLERDPFTLSGGEATRAAIALALAKQPLLVVFDQAYENLDPESVHDIRQAVDECLQAQAITVELAARMPSWLKPNIHSAHGIGEWNCFYSARSSATHAQHLSCPVYVDRRRDVEQCTENILETKSLQYLHPQSGFRLGPLDIGVRRGERVAIVGRNGSGKTTFLQSLALLLSPNYKELTVSENQSKYSPDERKRYAWASRCLYVFQNPDDQIYLPTVGEELESCARNFGRLDRRRLEIIADHFGFAPLLKDSPFSLPKPTRRLLTIASAIVAEAPVTLLDEPTVFLDEEQCTVLARAIFSFFSNKQCVLIISHDQSFVERTCTRAICLSGGQVQTA